jgi:hypothetical protein
LSVSCKLNQQVELFREEVEVAVFNRNDLEDGYVRVIFAAKFPEKMHIRK